MSALRQITRRLPSVGQSMALRSSNRLVAQRIAQRTYATGPPAAKSSDAPW
jgi:hypothetical protein